jgi:hypothetical protein
MSNVTPTRLSDVEMLCGAAFIKHPILSPPQPGIPEPDVGSVNVIVSLRPLVNVNEAVNP